ncbi:hypothetical protein ACFPPD_19300 [Cohnella suwonensis]|uniref:Uncharacterized protein n=1 Tax=Cohnella suwonensis TaxID=696072 RepID=A0ABW0LYE4_9BACL
MISRSYANAEQLFQYTKDNGLEGTVNYNGTIGPKSYYYMDARPDNVWVKTKNYQHAVCQISAIRKGKFGWGLMIDGRYVGVLEFPPSASEKKAFFNVAKQIIRGENKEWIQLDPLLSCKIKYQCLTKKGLLRSPVFEGFAI